MSGMTEERKRLYSVTRDGEVLATGLTEDEAFAWLLQHQGQSVHHATTHEGYAIVDEGRGIPKKS
jgi:hypothetical protein